MKGKLKTYYVSGFSRWFVIKAKNQKQARSEGVKEFGRGHVMEVRIADEDDIRSYKYWKGWNQSDEIPTAE